ncbi:MAG: glycosyltransferase family 39 protein [Ignavibacteriaceae bacterium]
MDLDEFQHLHIAWNIFSGKILYKDFFEHHGPIYSLLNGELFKIFNLSPTFDTIFFIRWISFFYMFILLFITFFIGKEILQSVIGGILSTAILSNLLFFQDSATEIRPDVLQNIFWLLGFLILLKNFSNASKFKTYFSGLFFCFAVLTNSKAAIGVFAVLVFYIFIFFQKKIDLKILYADLLLIFLGSLTSFIIISIYFISIGAFQQFWFYNFEFNLIAILKYHTSHSGYYLKYLLKHQIGFIIFTLFGFVLILKKFISEKENHDKKMLFLFIVSVITSASSLLGMYQQHYLQFLPLLSVICAFTINKSAELFFTNQTLIKKIVSFVAIIFLIVNLVQDEIWQTPWHESAKLKSQRSLTNFILKNTKRSEPIFFIWNNCGGYIFNEDVQYYWTENENLGKYFNRIKGYDVFGDALIKNMKTKNVRFIVAEEQELKNVLSPKAFNFIKNNYISNFNGYKCLWKRN